MALRYDQQSGRLELIISGQKLQTIIVALQDVLQCLQTSPTLSDVLLNPDKFFKQIRAVFAQCAAEDQVNGLLVLLEIVRDTFPEMDIKEKKNNLAILLSDFIHCLSIDGGDVFDTAFTLLNTFWQDESLRENMRPEFDATILNSNNKRLIDALKLIISSESSSRDSSRISRNSNQKLQASYWNDSEFPTNTGRSSSSFPSKQQPVTEKTASGKSFPFSPPPTDSPKVLKLSFLPHSMTEQWLLAHNAEELSFALDEINSVYNALSVSVREKACSDMPRAIKQIIHNLSGEALSVIISGLRLMESIAENHSDAFIGELDALFPKLHRYLEDQREMLRRNALRLAVALAARLPFQLTEGFITSAVEHRSIFADCALKLAGIALLNISSVGGMQISLGQSPNSSPAQLTSQQVRAARIAKAAVGYLAVDQELAAKLSSMAGSADIDQTPRTEATYDVAHDVIAAALLVLCPQEADLDTGIFPETLPQNFIAMLLLGSGQALTRTVQNEISLRASGLSFPSLVKDSDVASQVHMLLAARMGNETNKAMSGGLRDRTDSMSSSLGYNDIKRESRGSRSTSPAIDSKHSSHHLDHPGGSSPTNITRVKSKLFDAAVELNKGCSTVTEQQDDNDDTLDKPFVYVPSWSDDPDQGVSLQAHDWTPNIPTTPGGSVDQSKLASLKRFGRKPGSRRAHSAEVQSSNALLSELEPAPSTSDGVRGAHTDRIVGRKKLNDISDVSEADMGFSPKSTTSTRIGNYLDDEERSHMMTTVKAQGKKPKRRAGAGIASLSAPIPAGLSDQQAANELSMKDLSLNSTTAPSAGAPMALHSRRNRDSTNTGVPADSGNNRSVLPGASGSVGSRYRSAVEPSIAPPTSARSVVKANTGTAIKSADLFSVLDEQGTNPDAASPRISTDGTSIKRKPKRSEVSGTLASSFMSSPDKEHSIPSALKPDSLEYLESEDLAPLPNASNELPKLIANLETQEWPAIFYTLNSVRQIAVHHHILLSDSRTLHSLLQGILKAANNLRSAVAKNAILAIGDLFQGVERGMDSELPGVLALLLRKCGDTSIFLIKSAERAIHKMIDHSTATRSLAGLLIGTEHRNAVLRGKVAGYLHSLMLARASELKGSRELEGLTIRLGKLMSEHTPEARASGRDIARIMIETGLVSRAEIEMQVPSDMLTKALSSSSQPYGSSRAQSSIKRVTSRQSDLRPRASSDSVEIFVPDSPNVHSSMGMSGKLRPSALHIPSFEDYDEQFKSSVQSIRSGRTVSESSTGTPLSTAGSAPTPGPSRAKVAAAKRVMESNEELAALSSVIQCLDSSNWIERREAVTQITDLVGKHATVLRDASKLDSCIEKILERLDDGSVKVQLHTLSCLQRLHKDSSTILPSMQVVVIPGLLNAASSSNK